MTALRFIPYCRQSRKAATRTITLSAATRTKAATRTSTRRELLHVLIILGRYGVTPYGTSGHVIKGITPKSCEVPGVSRMRFGGICMPYLD